MTVQGTKVRGPTRESEEEADQDLTVAKKTATQGQMRDFLDQLRASCQEEGQSLTADTFWQRWQQARERAAEEVAPQSLTRAVASFGSEASEQKPEPSLAVQSLAGLQASSGAPSIDKVPPAKKTPQQLGEVQQRNNGWAVFVNIDGRKYVGPTRTLKNKAQKDLARARRCETREAVASFVQSLHQPGFASCIGRLSKGGKSAVGQRIPSNALRRAGQITSKYKLKKRSRENSSPYKFARKLRRQSIKHKETKRVYERSERAKLSRMQRQSSAVLGAMLFQLDHSASAQQKHHTRDEGSKQSGYICSQAFCKWKYSHSAKRRSEGPSMYEAPSSRCQQGAARGIYYCLRASMPPRSN